MTSSIQSQIFLLFIVWLGVILLAFKLSHKSGKFTVGLPLSFVFVTMFSYIGFFSYMVPDYTHVRYDGDLYLLNYSFSEATVLAGTQGVTLALTAFMLGCILFNAFAKPPSLAIQAQSVEIIDNKKLLMLLAGLFVLGLIFEILRLPIPMIDAFISTFENTGVVLFCVGALQAMRQNKLKLATLWLLASGGLPLYYLVGGGSLSRGFLIFSIIFMFWMTRIIGPRLSVYLKATISIASVYALIALFLTWLTFRDAIRKVVWRGAGFSERFDSIWIAVQSIEVFNPFNFNSLDLLNSRLNQYIFVGKAIEYHKIFPELKLYGETLLLIPFSLVPRVLWPEKPSMYQTPFVEAHTGMKFSASANFGAGQVFEFYVNFGFLGIFSGFLVMGLVLSYVDKKAAVEINRHNLFGFSKWFLVGIAFIAPLTQSFFIANSALFAFIVFTVIGFALVNRRSPHRY